MDYKMLEKMRAYLNVKMRNNSETSLVQYGGTVGFRLQSVNGSSSLVQGNGEVEGGAIMLGSCFVAFLTVVHFIYQFLFVSTTMATFTSFGLATTFTSFGGWAVLGGCLLMFLVGRLIFGEGEWISKNRRGSWSLKPNGVHQVVGVARDAAVASVFAP